ncbi:hypothetical protein L6452_11307 [Arctium lappa]|uniref:Uncharacterized protein n=1 Tax=Arctium lappa TaxID=4217 RepID=A0ACB9DNP4_ARCLA|nr:hypothetical protein L6452_11307 [Arctium lappa]
MKTRRQFVLGVTKLLVRSEDDDLALKQQLELYFERILDPNQELQKVALELETGKSTNAKVKWNLLHKIIIVAFFYIIYINCLKLLPFKVKSGVSDDGFLATKVDGCFIQKILTDENLAGEIAEEYAKMHNAGYGVVDLFFQAFKLVTDNINKNDSCIRIGAMIALTLPMQTGLFLVHALCEFCALHPTVFTKLFHAIDAVLCLQSH